jgi:hypothetical protein
MLQRRGGEIDNRYPIVRTNRRKLVRKDSKGEKNDRAFDNYRRGSKKPIRADY